jgi:hypothetical protein
MTPLDLRIKYRFETGYSPTFGKDSISRYNNHTNSYNYKGGLTPEYAEWIQSLQRGDEWKQEKYHKSTGHLATYYQKGWLKYTKDYKEWLENEFCHHQTWLEKHNMSYWK